MIRIGIIGLGFIGKKHLATLRQVEGVEVVAVADANPANFTTTAPVGNLASGSEEGLSLEGVAQYTDAGALLADPKVDVALIGLPTHLHAQFIKEALAAGKHVICEKPLVCDSATGEDLLKAIDASDRFVFVGHCIRFWPTYSVAYDRVKSGQYGRVLTAHFTRKSPKPAWSAGNWLMDPKKSGGAALDLHIHDVDYVHYLLGAPEKVEAAGVRREEGVSDVCAAYRYADGAVVTVHGSWMYHPGFPFRMSFEIVLEGATLEYDSLRGETLYIYTPDGKTETPELPAGDGYIRQHEYFRDCLVKGEAPRIVTPASSLEAVRRVEQEVAQIL